jgi:hypothetical protein
VSGLDGLGWPDEAMTPYEQAARWHLAHCPGVSFVSIIEAHLFYGHVISSPTRFVMGRQVRHDWPAELLLDPRCVAPSGNCWHVWLWAGTVEDWGAVVPYPLPWISFHRGERLRVHSFPAGK